ncbi:MAG: NTP transferase domain-containing protein [Candidatus Thorarchaeota archaeon]
MIEIRAVILSAGRGARLKPLTDHIPKALLECAGTKLVDRLIRTFLQSGFDEISVGVGWNATQIINHIEKEFGNQYVRVIDVPDYEKGPLQTLVTSLDQQFEPCVICPADLVFDPNILNQVTTWVEDNKDCDIAIAVDPQAVIGTDVYINDKGHISGLGEQVGTDQLIGKSAMLVVASSKFLELCVSSLADNHRTVASVITRSIESGLVIHPIEIQGKWFDIDSISELIKANRFFLSTYESDSENHIYVPENDTMEIGESLELNSGIKLQKGVRIIGPAIISQGCDVEANSVIGPFVSLGTDSRVSQDCTIRESILLDSSITSPAVTLSNVVVFGNRIFQERMKYVPK